MKTKRYKVVNPERQDVGKTIKAVPDTTVCKLRYIDVKTGENYSEWELKELPERHALYGGLHLGRLGIFLFGREYIKYHSYQFGVGVDFINSGDAYLDIEVRIACFGIGVRFVWYKKVTK